MSNPKNQKLFDRKLTLLLGLIVLLDLIILWLGPPHSLDVKLYYSGDEARALFAALTEADLKAYLTQELFDLGLIASYTTALFIGLSRTRPKKTWAKPLAFLPGFFDLVETLTSIGILRFGLPITWLDHLGLFTFVKWSGGALAASALFWPKLKALLSR